MKLLVSSRFGVSFVDVETEEVTSVLNYFGTQDLLPYGITWNTKNVYIAVRSQAQQDKEFICVYDQDLKYLSKIELGPDFFSNLHQIMFYDGKLFVCSSGLNQIIILRHGEVEKVWTPNPDDPKKKAEIAHGKWDWNHFNSIWFDIGSVFLVANNFARKSEIWQFSYPGLELECVRQRGQSGHNVCRIDGNLVSLPLSGNDFLDVKDTELQDPTYDRGLAVGDKIYIGRSQKIENRKERRKTRKGSIGVFNWQFEFEKEIEVGLGEIYEVRLWNDRDIAHCKY